MNAAIGTGVGEVDVDIAQRSRPGELGDETFLGMFAKLQSRREGTYKCRVVDDYEKRLEDGARSAYRSHYLGLEPQPVDRELA